VRFSTRRAGVAERGVNRPRWNLTWSASITALIYELINSYRLLIGARASLGTTAAPPLSSSTRSPEK